MTPEELHEIIKETIDTRPRDERKYYHLCWWNDSLRCLPIHHAQDLHPSFFMASHDVLQAGLSPHQMELIGQRVLAFCKPRHLSIQTKHRTAPDKRARAAAKDVKVTQFDLVRLQAMLGDKKLADPSKKTETARLRALLENAEIVPPREIPADVVTLNSTVRLQDKRNDLSITLSLIFPGATRPDANSQQTEAPILSPMGLSLLGRHVGDRLDGRIHIAELLYQPEAAGDFHL